MQGPLPLHKDLHLLYSLQYKTLLWEPFCKICASPLQVFRTSGEGGGGKQRQLCRGAWLLGEVALESK